MGRRRTPGTAMRLATTVVCAVAFVAGACSSDEEAPSGATVPEASTTSTTADPWAVPDPITEEYVERVLAELDRIDGDAARIIVAEGELVPAAVDRLRAIYGTDELNFNLELWGEYVARDFEGFRRPPGDRRLDVLSIRPAGRTCIALKARQDNSAIVARDIPVVEVAIEVRRTDPQHDPSGLNPTGWAISDQLSEPGKVDELCG